jgi:meso-butanediol dehydrogenase/(S,S)-butanediol dehydrogenase/diacetyl reductase
MNAKSAADDRRLDRRVAIITGTAGGQGRAAALRFAREGAWVVGCDYFNADGAAETVELVREAGGEMTSLQPLNLTDEGEVKRLVSHAVDTYGGLDILYNNAGAMRTGVAESMSVEDLDFTMAHEVTLVWLAVKHAIPAFRARGGGVIINIGSTSGMGTGTGTAGNARGIFGHCLGKAAVIRMGSYLAVELSPLNIRVNTISPGPIDTPATNAVFGDGARNSEARDAFRAPLLLRRVGRPDDIAAAAAFLASDDAAFITGVNLPVDGGWTGSGGMGMPNEAVERALEAVASGFATSGVEFRDPGR